MSEVNTRVNKKLKKVEVQCPNCGGWAPWDEWLIFNWSSIHPRKFECKVCGCQFKIETKGGGLPIPEEFEGELD